jgi:hypothetical protein
VKVFVKQVWGITMKRSHRLLIDKREEGIDDRPRTARPLFEMLTRGEGSGMAGK